MRHRLHLLIGLLCLAISPILTRAGPADLPWVYSTYLGSESEDLGAGIVVDARGRATAAGFTSGTNFPTERRPTAPQHGVDVFATRFEPDGAAINFSYWFNALTLDNSRYRSNYREGTALVQADGKQVVATPRRMWTTELTYEPGPWYARLGGKYTDRRYYSYTNDAAVPSFWLWNLSAGYRPGKSAETGAGSGKLQSPG